MRDSTRTLAAAIGMLASAQAGAACVGGGNLVPDCSFRAGIAGWSATNATGAVVGTVGYNAGAGFESPGSLTFASTTGSGTQTANASTCVELGGVVTSPLAARLYARGSFTISCTVSLNGYAAAACTGAPTSAIGSAIVSASGYTRLETTALAPAGFGSARVLLACTSSEAFSGEVDEVVLSLQGYLFSDSFE